ncbi:ABC transporter substrate-binding protein [Aquabacterium sp. A7-Y]|uniref:ABC transporter substrate-binding protein n=1 Tax=Aquabacterium sp. A7-Y TaxID=1349605 RepID=UPI00223D11D9|nr:ABC transporter substrate-binding protein [Aquabacterium sp. A7-Y]MCW7538089.1 ABC transporter substrate-binding protein [Aquabacterium sp. A7-Y]
MRRRNVINFAACSLAAHLAVAAPIRAAVRPKIALTLPIESIQSEVARDLLSGYQLAFERAEDVLDFRIRLIVEEDRSNPALTALNTAAFARDRSILAATGIVGTPHAEAALPIAEREGLPVIGIRSGAEYLRTGSKLIFHLRASYEAEITRMLGMVRGAALSKVAVLFSEDSFGRGAFEHLTRETARLGVKIHQAVSAERNGADVEDKTAQIIGAPGAHGLILLMITFPMLAALECARTSHHFVSPVFAMSFVANRQISSTPMEVASGLGMVSAFPLPRSAKEALAQDFRRRASGREGLADSLTAFEGFFYGSTIAYALFLSKAQTRQDLIAWLGDNPLDVGGLGVLFDERRVGFRHLQVVYKSGQGPLRV